MLGFGGVEHFCLKFLVIFFVTNKMLVDSGLESLCLKKNRLDIFASGTFHPCFYVFSWETRVLHEVIFPRLLVVLYFNNKLSICDYHCRFKVNLLGRI